MTSKLAQLFYYSVLFEHCQPHKQQLFALFDVIIPINIIMLRRRFQMSTLRNINLSLEIGQEILVGPNNDRARITKIEFHPKTGEISLNTTRGPRKALTFRICEDSPDRELEIIDPADRYR